MKVSRTSAAKAKSVLNEAPTAVIEAIERGQKSVHVGYQELRPKPPGEPIGALRADDPLPMRLSGHIISSDITLLRVIKPI